MSTTQQQSVFQQSKAIVRWLSAALIPFCWLVNGNAAPNIESSFPDTANLVTNGPVLTSVSYGSHAGTNTGHGIGLDAGNGLLDPRFPKVEKVVDGPGQVNVVISDNAGGWVIGGDFDTVGGVKLTNLAHILSDFSVNTAWRPNPDGAVHAIRTHIGVGGLRLLVGGAFSTIHGEARERFAELNTLSVAEPVTDISLSISGGDVLAIEKVGETVFIAGEFTQVRGSGPLDTDGDGNDDRDDDGDGIIDGTSLGYDADGDNVIDPPPGVTSTTPISYTRPIRVSANDDRTYIAALDLSKESNAEVVTDWFPKILCISACAADAGVRAMTAALSGRLFIGGKFDRINGVTRNHIAALNPGSTLNPLTTWNPGGGAASIVSIDAMAIDANVIDETSGDETGRVFVGGTFTAIGGQARENFAALDITTDVNNAVPTWSVPFEGTGVKAVARSEQRVYVGGDGTTEEIIVIDNETGLKIDSWKTQPNNVVNTLAVAGDTLYVGGGFTDLDSANNDGSRLYIGGDFTYIGPSTGSGVVVNNTNGARQTTWPEVNGEIYTVQPDGSSGWYIGGDFTRVGGIDRNNLARINSDGSVNDWNPNANGPVRAMALNGTALYVGGDFTSIDNIAAGSRNYLAKLDADPASFASGNYDLGWNPGPDNIVHTILANGADLYVGGDFTCFNPCAIATDNRGRLAKFISDALDDWDPNANGAVRAIALSGTGLYVGGDFTGIDNIAAGSRNYLAKLDPAPGTLAPGNYDLGWNPGPDNIVRTILVNGTDLYVGGDFNCFNPCAVAADNRGRIAKFSSDALNNWNPNANASVHSLHYYATAPSPVNEYIYISGDFTFIGSLLRNRVAVIDITVPANDEADTTWDPSAGDTVRAIYRDGANIFIGGAFSSVGGVTREKIAAIDLSDGVLDDIFDVAVNGTVRSLLVSDDGEVLYVGGDFTTIGGQQRNGIASLNTETGTSLGWNPDVTGSVYDMVMSEEDDDEDTVTQRKLYIAGEFTAIGGNFRDNVGAVFVDDGRDTGWNPSTNGRVRSVALGSSSLFIGGDFTRVNVSGQNVFRSHLASLNLGQNTDNATAWAPLADGIVRDIELTGSTLYVAGDFKNINDSGVTRQRHNLAAIDASSNAFNVLNWNPGVVVNASGAAELHAIALTDDAVFVGGNFDSIGGVARKNLAALNYVDGTALGWWDLRADSPAPSTETAVAAVNHLGLAGNGDRMIVGGNFRQVETTSSVSGNYTPGTYLRRGFTSFDAGFPHVITNPPAGAYGSPLEDPPVGGDVSFVCIDTPRDCASLVHYTTDGSDPDLSTAAPAQSVDVSINTTFKMATVDDSGNQSPVQTAIYIIDDEPPVTSANPPGPLPDGELFNSGSNRAITLECTDYGRGGVTGDPPAGCAEIYYTVDGNDPTTDSILYTGPIAIDENTVLKYFSVDLARNREVGFNTEQYWVDIAGPKVFASPGTGIFFSPSQTIKFLCSDDADVTESSIGDIPDADNPPSPDDPPPTLDDTTEDDDNRTESGCDAIYYTLDDSTPTTASTLYTGPFTVSESTVVKYIAIDHAGNSGGVQRASYVKNYSDNVGAAGPAWLGLMLLPWLWRSRTRLKGGKCEGHQL